MAVALKSVPLSIVTKLEEALSRYDYSLWLLPEAVDAFLDSITAEERRHPFVSRLVELASIIQRLKSINLEFTLLTNGIMWLFRLRFRNVLEKCGCGVPVTVACHSVEECSAKTKEARDAASECVAQVIVSACPELAKKFPEVVAANRLFCKLGIWPISWSDKYRISLEIILKGLFEDIDIRIERGVYSPGGIVFEEVTKVTLDELINIMQSEERYGMFRKAIDEAEAFLLELVEMYRAASRIKGRAYSKFFEAIEYCEEKATFMQ